MKMSLIANNKKANFLYHIIEKIEAGIVLSGAEVKSLRNGKASISEAYAETNKGELWLINSNISAYKNSVKFLKDEPKRVRKLLVHKKEIKKLKGKIEREGLTIIPLRLYFNKKGIVKLEIAIARGKKLFDKREDKKTKDWNRQKQRLMKKELN